MIFGDTKMPFDFYDIQLYGWNHAEKERHTEKEQSSEWTLKIYGSQWPTHIFGKA